MSTTNYFSSNCITLEVGCSLVTWNGTAWVGADSYTGVIDGKFSDGEYCYTVSNGIITSKDLCIFDVTMIVGYSNDGFYVQLWRPDLLAAQPISETITISAGSMTVVGYEDSACSINSSESDYASGDLIVPAGSVSAFVSGNFGMNSPPGGTTQYYHFTTTLTINGVSRGNNSNFTIGSGNITVQYVDTGGCTLYTD